MSSGGRLASWRRYLEQRFNHPFTSLPAWVPTASNRRMKDAARTLNGVVLALIQERRREGRDHGDLLSMLMQARDEETGEAMTEDQVCSEALTFLVAGHETTSTALDVDVVSAGFPPFDPAAGAGRSGESSRGPVADDRGCSAPDRDAHGHRGIHAFVPAGLGACAGGRPGG